MPMPDDFDQIQDSKHALENKAPMESWRFVWRDAVAPLLPTEGLKALEVALSNDDEALIQGATTKPSTKYDPTYLCEGACAISYCGWKGLDLETIQDVEQFFNKTVNEASSRSPLPGFIRWFLNWFDDAPRKKVVPQLLDEVRHELARRAGTDSPRQ